MGVAHLQPLRSNHCFLPVEFADESPPGSLAMRHQGYSSNAEWQELVWIYNLQPCIKQQAVIQIAVSQPTGCHAIGIYDMMQGVPFYTASTACSSHCISGCATHVGLKDSS